MLLPGPDSSPPPSALCLLPFFFLVCLFVFPHHPHPKQLFHFENLVTEQVQIHTHLQIQRLHCRSYASACFKLDHRMPEVCLINEQEPQVW